MNDQPVFPVVLCGGSGQRLWPASTTEMPKPFLRLSGARSLFQDTVVRVAHLAAGGGQGDPARAALEQLDADHLFLTPVAGEQRTWRYHSLFADYLRAQLERERPDEVARLHLAPGGRDVDQLAAHGGVVEDEFLQRVLACRQIRGGAHCLSYFLELRLEQLAALDVAVGGALQVGN
eukprot:gene8926-10974_t